MASDASTRRLSLSVQLPPAFQGLLALHVTVTKAAADAGLDPKLIELVKIRASQLNGCAHCLDMHTREAHKIGETQRRLFMLSAWRETELFTEQEQAALALTEAMTTLASHQDVPDDVYQQAAKVFTEPELAAVAWAITVINAFNRVAVFSRTPLPTDPS